MPPAKPEPGRDPQMAQRTRTLNVVFALSSLGLLLIFSLMIWADYDREWKRYQNEFNRLEVRLGRAQGQPGAGNPADDPDDDPADDPDEDGRTAQVVAFGARWAVLR